MVDSRIVIIGNAGMLGRAVEEELRAGYDDVVGIDIEEIDIADRERTDAVLSFLEPTVVINCAAYTNVDGCENERELAMAVNGFGPGNVAAVCRDIEARAVQFSTDFVFDGKKDTPYTEEDEPNPISVYGASKLEGEKQVFANLEDHVIIRTSWLFGVGGMNFVEKILARAKAGGSIKVVTDQRGCPTYTRHLARATRLLLDTGYMGIVNACNSGVTTWYSFAAKALELAGYDIEIGETTSDAFDAPAKRPANSALDISLLTSLIGEEMPPWEQGVEEYIKEKYG
ncbi:MAG: dTDP-4-dehydrorhamnose reductase [bacterium]|nr:dTDP-4-dehydrorhamnose reductase [bacterium]